MDLGEKFSLPPLAQSSIIRAVIISFKHCKSMWILMVMMIVIRSSILYTGYLFSAIKCVYSPVALYTSM